MKRMSKKQKAAAHKALIEQTLDGFKLNPWNRYQRYELVGMINVVGQALELGFTLDEIAEQNVEYWASKIWQEYYFECLQLPEDEMYKRECDLRNPEHLQYPMNARRILTALIKMGEAVRCRSSRCTKISR